MFDIPAIPAGAQLGGEGTAANHAGTPQAPAFPVAPQVPTPTAAPVAPNAPPTPVWNGTAWELPSAPVEQAPPSTPLVPVPTPIPVPPTGVPTADNPVTIDNQVPVAAVGETYIETSVNHFASEVGAAPEAIMVSIEKALEHGDASLINVANLGNLTPEQAQRATQLAQMVYQHTTQEIGNMKQAVHTAAGGEAQWGSAIGAFNANATQEAKDYVEYLTERKGSATANGKAAAEYVMQYVKGAGLTTQVTQAPVQGGTGAPVATGLTVQEYKNGIHNIELQRNARTITQSEYDVQLADLDYRRSVGRQQGR